MSEEFITPPEFAQRRGRGRPKGSPNKVQKAAKDAIAEAAEKLGGVNRLVTWSQEDPVNERAFWSTIYPKLLPLQVSGELKHTVDLLESLKRTRDAG